MFVCIEMMTMVIRFIHREKLCPIADIVVTDGDIHLWVISFIFID